MRYRRWVAAIMVAISATSILVGLQASVGATSPMDWSTTVNRDFVEIFSAADGSVTQTICGPTSSSTGATTYASGGGVQATIPTTSYGSYRLTDLLYCAHTAAADVDGTLYGNQLAGATEKVAAYAPDGTVLWSLQLQTTDCSSRNGTIRPSWIRLGADGNLYVLGRAENDWCGNRPYLASLTPRGALRWQMQINEVPLQMATYSTGLVVLSSEGPALRYYDYSGNVVSVQTITEPSNAGLGTISVNMDGVVFMMTGVYSQSTCGVGIESWLLAYRSSGRVFSRKLPACVTAFQTAALANGGVGYIQTLHPSIERTLVVLDPSGSTVSQRSLEGTDGVRQFSLGNFTTLDLIADTNGNLLLVRRYGYTHQAQTKYGLQFALVEPATARFAAVFNSDAIDTSARLNYRGRALAPGKLYLLADQCTTNNCSSVGDTKLYSVRFAKLGMDYPRGTILGVQSAAFDKMAVAGDSFSSGLGSLRSEQSYDAGDCSRSPNAYGRLLGEDPLVKLTLPQTAFAACAGATAADVLGQVGSIPANTKAVFLTVGGNDVKFARLGALCIFVDCSVQQYRDEFNAYLNGLDTTLANLYGAIAQQAPDAHVYVLNYPHLMPLVDCENAGSPWWMALLNLSGADIEGYKQRARDQGLTETEANLAAQTPPNISDDETLWSRTFQNQLNLKISDAVDLATAALPGRVHLVRTTLPGSPLEAHVLCSQTPYFNGLDGANPANTFHPNVLGQAALKQLAREALAQHQPQYVTAG